VLLSMRVEKPIRGGAGLLSIGLIHHFQRMATKHDRSSQICVPEQSGHGWQHYEEVIGSSGDAPG
jgi:hypothetical protein